MKKKRAQPLCPHCSRLAEQLAESEDARVAAEAVAYRTSEALTAALKRAKQLERALARALARLTMHY